MLRRDEEVTVGPGPESDHVWFTDGYGDYIRHSVSAMMTFPEWARRDPTHGRSADRGCVSLWPASATPSTFSTSGGAVELGVKFHSDMAGYILGIRFFKNSSDTGTDTGQLWTESGTLLGQVVFTTGDASDPAPGCFPTPLSETLSSMASLTRSPEPYRMARRARWRSVRGASSSAWTCSRLGMRGSFRSRRGKGMRSMATFRWRVWV